MKKNTERYVVENGKRGGAGGNLTKLRKLKKGARTLGREELDRRRQGEKGKRWERGGGELREMEG